MHTHTYIKVPPSRLLRKITLHMNAQREALLDAVKDEYPAVPFGTLVEAGFLSLLPAEIVAKLESFDDAQRLLSKSRK